MRESSRGCNKPECFGLMESLHQAQPWSHGSFQKVKLFEIALYSGCGWSHRLSHSEWSPAWTVELDHGSLLSWFSGSRREEAAQEGLVDQWLITPSSRWDILKMPSLMGQKMRGDPIHPGHSMHCSLPCSLESSVFWTDASYAITDLHFYTTKRMSLFLLQGFLLFFLFFNSIVQLLFLNTFLLYLISNDNLKTSFVQMLICSWGIKVS